MKNRHLVLVALLAVACNAPARPVTPVQGHHVMAMSGSVTNAQVVNFDQQNAATTATPGALAVQNIQGTLKQVNDQGVVTTLGGGGGLTPIAGNSILANATGSSALPTAVALDACHSFAGGVLTDLCPFGAATTINIPDGASNPSPAWLGTATLTTSTPGAQVSKYTQTLIDGASANHQVVALSLSPVQVLTPSGQTSTNPLTSGIGFVGAASPGTGFYYMPTGGPGSTPAIGISVGNGPGGGATGIMIDNSANLRLSQAGIGLQFGTNATESIGRDQTNGGIQMRYSGTTVLEVTAAKSVFVGGSVATTATDGFLYIPSCAGTPTGVPTAITGTIPMVWDRTAHKLYLYDNSAWNVMN